MFGSNLFGEIRRFARTSGAVGGIAARLAGERMFGIKTNRASHAEDLRTILGGLKGPLMKVAQFLSTIPDVLPAEYALELAADGLALRPPPHGSRTRPELGIPLRHVQPRGRSRRLARPGAPRPPAGRHRRRMQAAISRHAQHGGSRPAAIEAGDGGLSPH